MLLVYHSLVGSKLRYGLVCWATVNKTLLDKINVQNQSKLQQKMTSCILFLDLKTAFDSVSHKILIKKLEYYGIRGVALDLFRSYLSNRQQLTQIDDCICLC